MTMWGGRFDGEASDRLREFTADHSDRRLLSDDIAGSIGHVSMLRHAGILPDDEAAILLDGLAEIASEADQGTFQFEDSDEDVHSAVERRLGEIVGEVSGKLHTGRSRNDQVSLDLRIYLKRAVAARTGQLAAFIKTLTDLAERHADTLIPSYTHLQQAQPTSLGHHLLAYAWMALRDTVRFTDAGRRIDVSPLGAGASSGSTLPLDPGHVAEELGFGDYFRNSMDAVGSRDFVAEYIFCCAQAMVTLSRLAEEIILWASSEFAWLQLEDTVSTGSSALPHKRNPDMAELIRGRASAVLGDLTSIVVLQKALPLTYNRDLQEDKRLVFHADDTLSGSVEAMVEMLRHSEFSPRPPGAITTSLDLAEALVERGVPFRSAHEAVGRLIRALEADGRSLDDVTGSDLAAASSDFTEDDVSLVDPSASITRRRSPGSGSPESVLAQVAELRGILSRLI